MKRADRSSPGDVAVIGGGGHVGLPLALILADSGCKTVIYDINRERVEKIRCGVMPFMEEGGQEALSRSLDSGLLDVQDKPNLLAECKFLFLVVGTPMDEHLNPSFSAVHSAIDDCIDHLRDGQILILRSTVFPGITKHVQEYLRDKGLDIQVSFCPERVAQGYSMRELRSLPQIVSAFDPDTLAEVKDLFSLFASDLIEMAPVEAELTKLMTNAWRYIQFATVNQFYMIATEQGLDFERILRGCRHNYPRMAGAPGPGFAAGPCLVKDTMQLAAYCQNSFVLGHAAMLVNEGLPYHLVRMAKQKVDLSKATTGILGMAFKAESDDKRDSLSYKLKKLLVLASQRVLCSDPYVKDADMVSAEALVSEADVIFVGAPHARYKQLQIPEAKTVIDVWNHIASGPSPADTGKWVSDVTPARQTTVDRSSVATK